MRDLFLGIDFGTSGCRGCAIDARGAVVVEAAAPLPAPRRDGPRSGQAPMLWWSALREVAARLDEDRVRALSVDGTSGTAVAIDAAGAPVGEAYLYDDARAGAEAARIAQVAPRESAAHGPTSGLAKAMLMLAGDGGARIHRVISQADWILGRLRGRFDATDENNALKFGYDPVRREWPDWIERLGVARSLFAPAVPPGSVLGRIDAGVAVELGLPGDAAIVAGTTDSIAAFIAAGAREIGDAVTSLGSTLALKVLATKPVFSPAHGVYSHRLDDRWLAGGASNSGGAVLAQLFGEETIRRLTPLIDPDRPTGLDYYPLLRPGERFPISDPRLSPRLAPRPASEAEFLQGVLEGIARIERDGYRLLESLGAPYPREVRAAGGGARNPAFTRIRRRLLGVPMVEPVSQEAAYGAALLAARAMGAA